MRTNPFQEEGNDRDQARSRSAKPLEMTSGSVTRTQTQPFKEALDGLLQEVQEDEEHMYHTKGESILIHNIKALDEGQLWVKDG